MNETERMIWLLESLINNIKCNVTHERGAWHIAEYEKRITELRNEDATKKYNS